MDIKKALELIESGRFEELDIDDVWELINTLSVSSEPQAFQALVKLQNSKIGQSLPQMNMQMQYIIEQNAQAIEKQEKNFSLFDLDKKGQPLHKEILPIFNFFSRIEVENKEETEKVEPQKLFEQAVSIAVLTAKKDLALDKNFSRQKPEEQEKTYANTVLMAVEESAFVLVSNQILEDTLNKKHTPLSKVDREEIATKAEKSFQDVIRPKSQTKFKLTNSNIISTFAAEINRAGNKADLVEKNTGSKYLKKEVEKIDNKIQETYPETMQLLRPLAQYKKLTITAGRAGRNVFGADVIAKAVHEQNPAKGQQDVSLFAFLKKQPAKIKSFSRNIVRSLKKTYTIMSEAINFQVSSEKIADGFRHIFAFLGKHSNQEDKTAKYNNVGIKTLEGNLRIVSAQASQVINTPTTDKRVIAWKDFHNNLYNSQLGRAMALNPERAELTPDKAEDYTKITSIILPDKKKQPKSMVGKTLNFINRAILSPRGSNKAR